jgi:hypothetical protein
MLLMFFQETPDTVNYLILGYVIIGGVGLGYVLTMWLRQRNLKRDLEVIERLQKDDEE